MINMREKLMHFMQGRNGLDKFNAFLAACALVFSITGSCFKGNVSSVLNIISTACWIYFCFRALSRDTYKRSCENTVFLRKYDRAVTKLKLMRDKWTMRRDYKFFECPSCKAIMRVPRGKGKIQVVCRHCGSSFSGKT